MKIGPGLAKVEEVALYSRRVSRPGSPPQLTAKLLRPSGKVLNVKYFGIGVISFRSHSQLQYGLNLVFNPYCKPEKTLKY